MSLESLNRLNRILNKDGFILYISGAKEKGKTDFSLWLAEVCYLQGFRTKITTNIETESYMIEKQITNLPDLQAWLKEKGRKLFILDEAGLSIPKLRFMSQINVEVMKILQMIRHYDAGFIGISPSTRNVDAMFMDTDILDAHIIKWTKQKAQVIDTLMRDSYFLETINKTSINFNSKHIAEFKLLKEVTETEMPICCRVAYHYRLKGNYKTVGILLNLQTEQVKRELLKHLAHTEFTVHSHPEGIDSHESPPKTLNSPLA